MSTTAVSDISQVTTTVTTFRVPAFVVELPRGERTLRILAHTVEVRATHDDKPRVVYISGPFLRADGTQGAWHQHRVHDVPHGLQLLIEQALEGGAR
ncbi:hypothetical protein [Kineococcus radiotolerans]|uniref:Uncharacterized protein n=1 Tax=Kineococcus radiotolerans (strain ATCC BAA-149 / DSM 14245 / SRS30216) TaxID=266940 RepID=A6W8W7_KINRD|nr:hypothetical protein [Kineococcus radiotolerans]ABS03256.1 hypothetical protein Krad_1770 [Kineococcus radiotolerans SRS30216 = ATCC BAA-149]